MDYDWLAALVILLFEWRIYIHIYILYAGRTHNGQFKKWLRIPRWPNTIAALRAIARTCPATFAPILLPRGWREWRFTHHAGSGASVMLRRSSCRRDLMCGDKFEAGAFDIYTLYRRFALLQRCRAGIWKIVSFSSWIVNYMQSMISTN
jgi:hypothetical protein